MAVLVGLCAGCVAALLLYAMLGTEALAMPQFMLALDRKSTRLNSSHT